MNRGVCKLRRAWRKREVLTSDDGAILFENLNLYYAKNVEVEIPGQKALMMEQVVTYLDDRLWRKTGLWYNNSSDPSEACQCPSEAQAIMQLQENGAWEKLFARHFVGGTVKIKGLASVKHADKNDKLASLLVFDNGMDRWEVAVYGKAPRLVLKIKPGNLVPMQTHQVSLDSGVENDLVEMTWKDSYYKRRSAGDFPLWVLGQCRRESGCQKGVAGIWE